MAGQLYILLTRLIKSESHLEPSDKAKTARIMQAVLKNPFDTRAFDLFQQSLTAKYGNDISAFLDELNEIIEKAEMEYRKRKEERG